MCDRTEDTAACSANRQYFGYRKGPGFVGPLQPFVGQRSGVSIVTARIVTAKRFLGAVDIHISLPTQSAIVTKNQGMKCSGYRDSGAMWRGTQCGESISVRYGNVS
jgi:hypothetical protein